MLHSRYRIDARFTGFTLSDCYGGEKLTRHTINAGEIVITDRAFGRAQGQHVLEHQADFIVRGGWRSLGWRDAQGRTLDIRGLVKRAIWRSMPRTARVCGRCGHGCSQPGKSWTPPFVRDLAAHRQPS